MNDIVSPTPRSERIPRARHLLVLDTGMLVLACLLQALSLTGLQWHEWLGFVLCALVLLHVILQWPWFITAFRKLLAPGARRTRINLVLNLLLFIAMVSVLVSGVLISNQIAPLVGRALGRPRVWSELHGWLNFTLMVLVGVHLAVNWDYVLGAIRRRTVPLARLPAIPGFVFRGTMVLFVAALVSAAAYATMDSLVKPSPAEKRAATQTTANVQPPKPREGRTQSFRVGLRELYGAILVVIFAALVGRYVLRIHL